MSNHTNNKTSFSIEKLLPVLENENFSDFLKAYYQWMESSKITVANASGSFTLGETVIGLTSGVTGKIKHIGDDHLVLEMYSEFPFEISETIQGQGSSVTATITDIEDNILRKAGNLVQNKTFEYASGDYYEYLKTELTRGIPSQTETDRRLLAEKIKEFYSSKSTEDAYRFLFKTVFNDDVIFRFPGDEILRVSDGRFEKTSSLRVSTVYDAGDGNGPQSVDVFSLLNKTVRGRDSNAVANIVDIRITFLGGVEFAELTLTLVSGEFIAGEEIFDVDNPTLITTTFGLISGFTINDGGSGYSVGDSVTITGDGFEATASVSSINSGVINTIAVTGVGHGYRLGTRAVVDNTNTGGTGLVVEVTGITNTYEIGGYTVGEISEIIIRNRGEDYFAAPTLTLEDTIISAIGALSAELIAIDNVGDDYAVGDALVFSAGTATGIVASVAPSVDTSEFSFEDDFNLTLEGEDGILINDDPLVDGLGPISRIELTDFGTGYTNGTLPTIDMTGSGDGNATLTVTGIQGTSAQVSVDADAGLGLGSIREIVIDDFGVAYTTATASVSGGDGNAVITPIISGLGVSAGEFLTTDGLVGRRIIQDSLFFQDFSYVIRSGLGFNSYRSIIKDVLHPAGTEFFGEIVISSLISVAADFTSIITQPRPSSSTIFLEEVLAFTPNASSTIKLLKEIVSAIDYGTAPIVATNSYQIEMTPTTVDVSPSMSLTINFLSYQKSVVSFSTIIHTPPASQITLRRELKQELDLVVRIVDPFGPTTGTLFGDLPISVLAADQISTYKFKKFSDPYDTQRPMYRNSPITGTVSTAGTTVTGSGTSFDTEFVTGEYIIIDTEKFLITSINSPTELIVNVVPAGVYSNVAALREFLL